MPSPVDTLNGDQCNATLTNSALSPPAWKALILSGTAYGETPKYSSDYWRFIKYSWGGLQILWIREGIDGRDRLGITLAHFLGGGLSRKAHTAGTLEGGGGSKIKCWHADTFKGRGGRVETKSKYCCKIFEIIIKVMNFFLNHALS